MSILPQILINALITGSFYTLISLGFNLIYSTTKFFNLALGVTAAFAGYVVFYLTYSLNINLYLAIIVGTLTAGLLGVLTDEFVYKPLRLRKASPMVLLVASLGVFTVLQASLAIFFTSQFQTLSKVLFTQPVYHFGNASITLIQVIAIFISLLCAISLTLFLKHSYLGKKIKAVADDEEVAKVIGIDTNSVMTKVLFIGSCFAGIAGILIGLDTGIEPNMGMPLLLKGIISAIIGGIRNIQGSLIGGFLLSIVENFGIIKIDGQWKDALAFAVLIIFLIWRPSGILKR